MTAKTMVYAGFMPAGRPATKKAPIFGQRLAALRQNRGWTQPQLAEQLGVSVKTITYYERSAQNPTSKTLDRIAEILGVEPSELIRAADQQTRKSKSGPPSRLHLLFDQVSGLPRGKQKIVTDLLEGYLEKSAK